MSVGSPMKRKWNKNRAGALAVLSLTMLCLGVLYTNATNNTLTTFINNLNLKNVGRIIVHQTPGLTDPVTGKPINGITTPQAGGGQYIQVDSNLGSNIQLVVIDHEYVHGWSHLNDDPFNVNIGGVSVGDASYDNYFAASEVPAWYQNISSFPSTLSDYAGQLYGNAANQQGLLIDSQGAVYNAVYTATKNVSNTMLNYLNNSATYSALVNGGAVNVQTPASGTQNLHIVTTDDGYPMFVIADSTTTSGYMSMDFPAQANVDLTTAAGRSTFLQYAINKLSTMQVVLSDYDPNSSYVSNIMAQNLTAAQNAIATDAPSSTVVVPAPAVTSPAIVTANLTAAMNSIVPGSGDPSASVTNLDVYAVHTSVGVSTPNLDGSTTVTTATPVTYIVIKYPSGQTLIENQTTGATVTYQGNPSTTVAQDLANGTISNTISTTPAMTADNGGTTSGNGAVTGSGGVSGGGGGTGSSGSSGGSYIAYQMTYGWGGMEPGLRPPPKKLSVEPRRFALSAAGTAGRAAGGVRVRKKILSAPVVTSSSCTVRLPSCPGQPTWTPASINSAYLFTGNASSPIQTNANQCMGAAQNIYNLCKLPGPMTAFYYENGVATTFGTFFLPTSRDNVAPATFTPGLNSPSISSGASATLSFALSSGSSYTAIRWYKNGVLLSPQPTGTSLMIAAATASNAGTYSVQVDTPSAGTITSSGTLSVATSGASCSYGGKTIAFNGTVTTYQVGTAYKSCKDTCAAESVVSTCGSGGLAPAPGGFSACTYNTTGVCP